MFKRFIYAVTFLVAGLFAASNSWGLSISDVGAIDEFVGSTTISNSGNRAELGWIQSILGADATIEEKYDSGASEWMLLDGEFDVYAAELASEPEYYFLKLGTGGTSLDSHYLFRNIGDLSYAVVDFSAAGIDMSISKVNVGRISHVGEIYASVMPVSEPSSIILLSLGLVALVVSRRRTARL